LTGYVTPPLLSSGAGLRADLFLMFGGARHGH
jgi:hypothetical protein